MKVWRDVWHSYYIVATRTNYWKQLFRAASWLQIVVAAVAITVVAWSLLSGRVSGDPGLGAYFWLYMPMGIFLAVLDNVRTKTFTENFGGLPEDTAPPESENFRRDRYVLFRDALRKKEILGSEVGSLIDLVDARLDMEQHHNELMKKFGLFGSGFLTAMITPWLKEASRQSMGLTIASAASVLFVVMLVLWLVPSRKARLRELKYFMMIYERE
nr:hypothetical protein [uncultured Pseudoxanthomonas sp.]